ncbi:MULTISPECIES: urease accessory protein UreD [Cyanophyceae]|uniref:urease accessory protein UreD n=1 Tax=Cyanophyceae TaxID=3028117 RepID=UPI00168525E2|nr:MULTISPECIES: urease accessory protein UreD [Cyanophyceae]MBD1917700.1 urease accessory protein UreD [Phormidium sp. FACHB-77]MBD2031168.1 urease accessory protein UreD [Phormidium sp. FACHB-322]MBD2053597.1 urease accessory protein UreD [Leptolyngbya sp. FACHB-60]
MVQSSAQAPKAHPGWRGLARLSYAMESGRCVPTQTYTRAPLRVQRPLYPEGEGLCHTVLVHTAGGLVGGDSLVIALTAAPRAQALVTTAAASKVYGSADIASSQQVDITLAPESCLEWFPHETIVFNQAHYNQALRVDLAPGAIWAGWEITRFGRSARGETFEQGQWRSRLEVWQVDQPLWLDRQHLTGGSATLHSPNGLAGHPVVGSFAVVGHRFESDSVAALRQLWPTDQPGDIGVTRLQSGLLCRYRGPSSQAARRWFVAAWQHLRPLYLGRSAAVSRLWPR